MKKGFVRTALALLLAAVFAAGCSGAVFSSEDWIAADEPGRQKMVNSLMKEYDLVGWTEPDVVRLLGPETSADPDFTGSLRHDTDSTLVYALGAADYANVKMLVITLDENRIVTGWELVTESM